MSDFRKWKIWQESRGFVKKIYEATSSFPTNEQFGLTAQLRRAAVSIPVNIAEGAGRGSGNELRHFLHISLGSAFEVETLLLLCRDLNFLTEQTTVKLLERLTTLQKQINAFIQKLKNTPKG